MVSDRCDWQQRARTNARVTNDSGVTISIVDLNKRDFRGNARLEHKPVSRPERFPFYRTRPAQLILRRPDIGRQHARIRRQRKS
jgi:hypothetical protein